MTTKPPVKTVFDILLGNGQWRQYTSEPFSSGSLSSLFRLMSEDLELEELEHGAQVVVTNCYPTRPGHDLQFNPVFHCKGVAERKADLLHKLLHFFAQNISHGRGQDLCFDYELPEQEWGDPELVRTLSSVCQAWAKEHGAGQLTVNVLPVPYLPPEVGEASSLLVRFFKRQDFTQYRLRQLEDARKRFQQCVKEGAEHSQPDERGNRHVTFEVEVGEQQLLTRDDLWGWVSSLWCWPCVINWPGDAALSADNFVVVKVVFKE